MKIYTKISEWLKDFSTEDSNEKILKIINKVAETEFKKEETKRKKVVEKLKKEIEEKQLKLKELEGGVIVPKKVRKPRTKKVK
jgi:hypothetical protein